MYINVNQYVIHSEFEHFIVFTALANKEHQCQWLTENRKPRMWKI